MTGLQQHGWHVDAQPQLLLEPSWFQPWNSQRRPVRRWSDDNVATTTLQNLIHFMTRSLLPLGFDIVGRLHPVGDGPANCLFVGDCHPPGSAEAGCQRRASRFSEITRPRSRRVTDDKNVFHHASDAFAASPVRHGFPIHASFQSIREVAPSRSVCEGLDQSIGGIRTTA